MPSSARLCLAVFFAPSVILALDSPLTGVDQDWDAHHHRQTNESVLRDEYLSTASSFASDASSSTLPASTCRDETQGPYATLAGARWEASPGWSCPGDDLAEFNISTLATSEVALRFCAWLCRQALDCLAIALHGRHCRLRRSGLKSVTLDESCSGGRWDSTGNYYTMLQRVCLKEGPFDGVWLEQREGKNYTHRIEGTTLSWEDSFETALNFSSNTSFTTRLGSEVLHASLRQEELIWRSDQKWSRLRPLKSDSRSPLSEVMSTQKDTDSAGAGSEALSVNTSSEASVSTSPCSMRHGRFSPLNMRGTGPTEEASPEACRLRCQRTAGCEYFSVAFSNSSVSESPGTCHLQDGSAHWVADAGFRSGLRSCVSKDGNSGLTTHSSLTRSADSLTYGKCYGPAFTYSTISSDGGLDLAMHTCRDLCQATTNCSTFCLDQRTRNCSLIGPMITALHSHPSLVGGRLSCEPTSRKFLIPDDEGSLLGIPPTLGVFFASGSLLAILGSVFWMTTVRCSSWLPRLLTLPLYDLHGNAASALPANRSARYISLPLEEELSDYSEDDLVWD